MTDEDNNPRTSPQVRGASEDVLADTCDSTAETTIDQEIDVLIDELIELDRAFETNWTDTDIDLSAAKPPHIIFTLPEMMLLQALSLKPDISEELQIGLVEEYFRTHGDPDEWAEDAQRVQKVIETVKDHLSPSRVLYEVEPEGLLERPTPPPATGQELIDQQAPELILNPTTPLDTAKQFVHRNFRYCHKTTLIRNSGDFYTWDGRRYADAEEEILKAELYKVLEVGTYFSKGEMRKFNPTQAKVNQVVDAVKAHVQLPSGTRAPSWLDQTNYPPANEIVACENGLLHLPTRELLEHTPTFLSHNSLGYAFEPDAPEPTQFFDFLDSILDDDQEAEDLLQEVVGYIVSGATSLQKIFAIVGPKRAGKGVLGRLIIALIGAENSCSPSLASFATPFPLQPLLGKTLALMSDARLDSQVNQKAIVEHMLRVSGEDDVNVARKNRTDWSGRLSARFMLLTNEVPRLADASGALAGRFVTLVLTKSFFGKEDPTLTDRLLTELPGVLNWALEGWDRLQEQGRFTVPASSVEVMKELEYLSSPVLKFVDDHCVVGDGEEVTVDNLYRAWAKSCERDGQYYATTKATFARDLHAAFPSLKKVRRNKNGFRVHVYLGIGLRPSPLGAIVSKTDLSGTPRRPRS